MKKLNKKSKKADGEQKNSARKVGDRAFSENDLDRIANLIDKL